MTCRSLLRLVLPVLLFSGSALAQLETSTTHPYRDIRVHVAFASGEACDSSTRVVLLDRTSAVVGQGVTDASCVVEFAHVPAGTYHVMVSGKNFASTDSSDVVMNSPDTEELEVRVRRTGESGANAANPVVTLADYKVPVNASKEFRKANQAMQRQDWAKAIERLHKALAIYPGYAAAYNNLGVCYARLGDRTSERAALESAINLNDRLAPVYVNLARMEIALQNFTEAETALKKATDLDPRDGSALVMLANVEIMNHHLDEAIETSRKVHAMVQPPHSTVHWVAAHAFEQKRQYDAAIAELVLFLSEEKSGTRADQVRRELAQVQSAPRESIRN